MKRIQRFVRAGGQRTDRPAVADRRAFVGRVPHERDERRADVEVSYQIIDRARRALARRFPKQRNARLFPIDIPAVLRRRIVLLQTLAVIAGDDDVRGVVHAPAAEDVEHARDLVIEQRHVRSV